MTCRAQRHLVTQTVTGPANSGSRFHRSIILYPHALITHTYWTGSLTIHSKRENAKSSSICRNDWFSETQKWISKILIEAKAPAVLYCRIASSSSLGSESYSDQSLHEYHERLTLVERTERRHWCNRSSLLDGSIVQIVLSKLARLLAALALQRNRELQTRRKTTNSLERIQDWMMLTFILCIHWIQT